MNTNKRYLIIGSLIEELRGVGNWTGETHIQKAVYFLKTWLNVDINVDFILYSHGPFSFDLRDDIDQMRSIGYIKREYEDPKYGPKINVTEEFKKLKDLLPRTNERYHGDIHRVANIFQTKGVLELEKIATALYMIKERYPEKDDDFRAVEINKIKPHITTGQAKESLDIIHNLLNG